MSFLDRLGDWVDGIVHHDDHVVVVVRKGDSLWSIAKEASGSVDVATIQREVHAIQRLNPQIADPDRIHPGQELKLPKSWSEG